MPGVEVQAVGAELDLLGRFLGRDVDDRPVRLTEHSGCLENEGGLADARVTTEEHKRTRHEATTEDAPEFGDRDRDPVVFVEPNRRERLEVGP